MRKIVLILSVISFTIVSCGTKPSKSLNTITKDVDAYKTSVDSNVNLQKETIEGALADTDGFKDIGHFTYTVYFDATTKSLVKIKNVEQTDSKVSETYYFKDGNLVLVDLQQNGGSQLMYLQKKKVVSDGKMETSRQHLLLDKAKRFQTEFEKSH